MSTILRHRLALAILFGITVPVAASGQSSTQAVGLYVIRPGDTLEGLSVRFLGVPRQWPELHELNPHIRDPHWIYPGRRVRIPLDRPSLLPNAQVISLANRVEAQPSPVEWLPAGAGDLLLERDGLRTFESSSAELLFDDGTTAVVAPDSLVFIRRQTLATDPAPRKEIEIEVGQAEFATRKTDLVSPEIEVVIGGTRSTTHADAQGEARSRHRKQGDGAQVMLYEGGGEVRGDGGAVTLARGMGTTVRAGFAPDPPEPLLAAPVLELPRDRYEVEADEKALELSWREVPGADGYVIELCADATCGALLERSPLLRTTRFRLRYRPAKVTYWRVTAVSPSGLDGYPAPVRSIRPRLLISYN